MMPSDHKDIAGRNKVIHPFPEAVMAIMEPKRNCLICFYSCHMIHVMSYVGEQN